MCFLILYERNRADPHGISEPVPQFCSKFRNRFRDSSSNSGTSNRNAEPVPEFGAELRNLACSASGIFSVSLISCFQQKHETFLEEQISREIRSLEHQMNNLLKPGHLHDNF